MKAIGLDIGTTTVCAIVLDTNSGNIVKSVTLPNDSFIEGKPFEKLQNPDLILKKATALIDSLIEEFGEISCIGVTGQMHGIIYLDKNGNPLSNLYIWQDGSGNEIYKDRLTYAEFLTKETGYKMASGFGLTTYFYHAVNKCVPKNTASICTIHDYVAMKLANRKSPVMHSSDAASFGLFDIEKSCFDTETIGKIGLDTSVFPEVTGENKIIGMKNNTIPVSVAIGDNQASFIGSVDDIDKCLLVNVGTGSQISFSGMEKEVPAGLEIRPCILDKTITVGSSLCGGRAFALLENFFRITAEMVTNEKISTAYKGMDKLLSEINDVENPLDFSTLFCGTRENPNERASIKNIGTDNFTPAHFIFGVLNGMADELYSMYFEATKNSENKPASLVASGNGIRKNLTLQKIVSEKFGMKLKIPCHKEEAAFGSIVFALTAAGITSSINEAQKLIKYE